MIKQMFNGDPDSSPLMHQGAYDTPSRVPDPHLHGSAIMHIVDPESGQRREVTVREHALETHVNPVSGKREPNYDPQTKTWTGPWVTQVNRFRYG